MFSTQYPWRELYDGLLAGQDVLDQWCVDNDDERRFLADLATRAGEPWPAATDEDLCRLYAASRVNDVLLERFERDAYTAFWSLMGMRVVTHPTFEPFFHEIVEVKPIPAGTAVVAEHWPALMLGDLMFSRAGCTVEAAPEILDPAIAASSRLHWTHRRPRRPTTDLSVGWGSNSQWRTRFRRDYHLGGAFHFNVDGSIDVRDRDTRRVADPELTTDERIELLTHRCFVRCAKPDDDLWPWDDRYSA